MPAVCNNFVKLKTEAEKDAQAMQKIGQSHGDRKAMCGAVTRFAAAETLVVKFLERQQDLGAACPIRRSLDQKPIMSGPLNSATVVCARRPKPHTPSLSDASARPNSNL